ncbi:MAG TPA: SDR family NAD(P)-dependent oxidoreductase [Roseateles sp.]
MMMQGNTILVAGAASGIGRGLAELLCRLGNEVLIVGAEAPALSTSAGMRVVDLDLADPWSVAAFSEQVAAICPGLNMLVNISIAFPVKHLPGLQALLEADDSHEKLEAHRLGIQHLTSALLPHFRKRTHSSVLNVSAGPLLAPQGSHRGGRPQGSIAESGVPACAMTVRRRWACASIDVIDVAQPSRAERIHLEQAVRPRGLPRAEFLAGVAHVLAEGLHEAAALARLQALWPQPAVRQTRDDDLVSEAW